MTTPEIERELDDRATRAIASVRPDPSGDGPTREIPTRENAPMAWDLTRFGIWLSGPGDPIRDADGDTIRDEDFAIFAMEYTGE